MPTRYIATRVAIEGEKEYKDSVRNINTELKTLDSQLKLVGSQFKENANTQEALKAKSQALNDLYSKQAEKVDSLKKALDNAKDSVSRYSSESEKLKSALESNKQQLDGLQKVSGDTAEEQQKLTDEQKKLTQAIKENESYLEAANRGVNGWQTSLNSAQIKLNDLDSEINENNRYLDEAARSADGIAGSIDAYGNKVKEAGDKTQGANQAFEAMAAILVAAGVQKAVSEIADALKACSAASMEFESGFAGVKKTVDGTAEELDTLKSGIKNMSLEIPAATSEINAVAEAAGQLGIQVSDIEKFTEVMINLGVSTNLSAETAASTLAKFANIVGMSADDYERLGSVIVALGNNFATTESDIVNMATRLASTGAVVGLTEPQIMAIATALSSVGIEAEAGGSAVSKLLKQFETAVQTYAKATSVIDATGHSMRELELMSANNSKEFKALADSIGLTSTELNKHIANAKKLEQFADIAGVTADEFIQAWGVDAVKALDMFITGLGEVDRNGGSAVAVLDEMGLTEIRLSNAVLALASSNGVLTESVDLANLAWIENIALTNEANQRYATTESKVQLFKNSVELLKIAIGDDLNVALGDLADAGADVTVFLTDFIEKNEWAVPAITALTTALGVFVTGVTAAMAIGKLTTLLAAFVTPAGAVAAAVAGIVAALIVFEELMPNVADEYKEFNQSIDASAEATNKLVESSKKLRDEYQEQQEQLGTNKYVTLELISELQRLSDIENKSAADKEMLLGIIDNLNSAIPNLNLSYDEQNDLIKTNTGEVLDNADALIELFNAQMKQEEYRIAAEHLNETLAKQKELELQLITATDKLSEAKEHHSGVVQDSNEYYDKYNNKVLQTIGLTDILIHSDKKYAEALSDSTDKVETASGAVANLEQELENTSAELENAKNAVNRLADASDNAVDSVDNVGDALEETGDHAIESTEKINAAMSVLEAQMDDLNKAYETAYKSAYSSISSQHKLFSGVSLAYESTAKAAGKVTDAQVGLKKELSETESILKSLQSEYDSVYKSAYSGIGSQYKLYSGIADLLKEIDAKKAVSIELEPSAIDFKAQLEIVNQALEDLQKEYDDAYNAAYKSIDGQNKLFAEQTEVTGKSVDEMLVSMRKQTQGIYEYSTNLQAAIRGGFNKDLIAQMADGSAQSAANLKNIVDEYSNLVSRFGEESFEVRSFVNDFNSIFEETGEAKEFFAETVSDMETDFSEKSKSLQSEADDLRKNIVEPFEETTEAIPHLMSAIVGGMKEQAQGIKEYTQLLNNASEAGFSEGFVKTLSDGSETSQKILSALMDRYNELIETFGEGGTEVEEFVNTFNDSFAETEKAKDIFATTVAEMQTDFSATAELLIAKVAELSSQVVESSSSTGSAIQEISKTSAQLVSDMLKSMEEETTSIIEHINLLNWAAETGFTNGFVAALADGSEDSKAYLNAVKDEYQKLVDRFGESSAEVEAFVNDFNQKFEGLEEAKATFAGTTAEIVTSFEETHNTLVAEGEELAKELAEVINPDASVIENNITNAISGGINSAASTVVERAKSLGGSIARGVAKGISDGTPEIQKSIINASNAASLTFKVTNEIASPSKKYQRLAAHIPEGVVLGIESQLAEIKSASAKMSAALEENFNKKSAQLYEYESRMIPENFENAIARQNYNSGTGVRGITELIEPVTLDGKVIATIVNQIDWDRQTIKKRNKGG